jgi:nucleotide-binding universal stress UspA family protein
MSGIVVGVDGSDGSKQALEWAAAEAKLRELPLTVLLAWHIPSGLYAGGAWTALTPELKEDVERRANQRLEETCAAVGSALDGLEVKCSVVRGLAPQALIEAAQKATMLVVGTRGHGGFVGLLLGSVSQQCAHHSPCPIVIVPPRTN